MRFPFNSRTRFLTFGIPLLFASACATSSEESARPAAGPHKAAAAQQKGDSEESRATASKKTGKGKPGAAKIEAQPTSTEPELPTGFDQPMVCSVPSEVPAAKEITLRCAIKAGMGIRAVMLHYRPQGTEEYTHQESTKTPKGWYLSKVPASAVHGGSVQYYFEARSAEGRTVAFEGTDESPTVALIQGATPTSDSGDFTPEAPDDTPALQAQRRRAEEEKRRIGYWHRPDNSLWVGMGIGTAMGWFPKSKPEFWGSEGSEVPAAVASGGYLHLSPEVGFQINNSFAVSVQGRYQFVPQEGSGASKAGAAPTKAMAVIARAYWFKDDPIGINKNLQFFVNGNLGVGDGFRLYVAPDPNTKYVTSDTVRGGPMIAGLGVGTLYHFTDYLAGVLELRGLSGFPDFALAGEVNFAMQFALWKPSEQAPPRQPDDLVEE